jgi:hypothetical protein
MVGDDVEGDRGFLFFGERAAVGSGGGVDVGVGFAASSSSLQKMGVKTSVT